MAVLLALLLTATGIPRTVDPQLSDLAQQRATPTSPPPPDSTQPQPLPIPTAPALTTLPDTAVAH